ncbi:hypothetical protein BDR06DRAFT_784459 [Suillus hirtellus]|nr:hypothetical protein BDR06DRAFT_784459 [Suillus hirtellus]
MRFVLGSLISYRTPPWSLNTTPVTNPGTCLFFGGRNDIFEYAVLLLYELDPRFSLNTIRWVSITDSPQIVIHSVPASSVLVNLRAREFIQHWLIYLGYSLDFCI